MKKLCFIIFISIWCNSVHAKAMDGNMALIFCNDTINCALIANSYSDGFSYALMAIRAENTIYCMPSAANSGLLGRIFKKYLIENPEKLHFSAASLAITAFSEAFPCPE